MTKPILIIDDQADIRMSASIALANQGYQCLEADGPHQALTILKQQQVSLVLLDMNFSLDTTSGKEGLHFLKTLQKENITLPIIVITAWSSVEIAVQAMQLGAVDFIEKPWKNTVLINKIKQQITSSQLTQENQRYQALTNNQQQEVFVQSPQMTALLTSAMRVAKSDANILITGENGTGKSMLAKFIHQHSSREKQRFVSINMGAIPEQLFESELFGHTKGAFTDAKENRLGRFDIASSGTLFLDEIGTLPPNLQTKMLRVLETGEYEILGSSQTQTSNARIISATNANLDQLIEQNHFRQDLLFRLNTIELNIPPLRERPDDIILLATSFLAKHAKKYQRSALSLTPDAQLALKNHQWTGNVRELSHCIERAVIMSEQQTITPEELGLNIYKQKNNEPWPLMNLEESEKKTIIKAISHFNGNVMLAGDYLGISKSAIYRRIEKYALDVQNLPSLP